MTCRLQNSSRHLCTSWMGCTTTGETRRRKSGNCDTRPVSTPQLGLFDGGAPAPAAPTDLLFFALQLEAAAARATADLAMRLRTQYGLKGKPLPPERLHITLYFLGGFPGVPQDLVDSACNALAALREPSFDVCLDRVLSFRGKSNRPVVLVGGDSLAPLHQFQGRLRSALLRAHIAEPGKEGHVHSARDSAQG